MITIDHAAAGGLGIVLGEAHSTSSVGVVVSYRTINPDVPSNTSRIQSFNSNGTTGVSLLTVPSSPIWYDVDNIVVHNADSISHTFVLAFGFFNMFRVLLLSGERAEYNDREGWKVYDTNGAVKITQTEPRRRVAFLTADVTNNNGVANTIADVTGLSFPVSAGKRYRFRFTIDYTAAAGTTGSRWSINGPAATRLAYDSEYALTTTTRTLNVSQNAYDLPAASNATTPTTAGNVAYIEGFITPSASGNVIARFASEVAASAIVAKAGSYVEYEEV